MQMRAIMARAPVIPVLTIERESDAVPLARALCAGGLTVLEVTLRTSAALAAISAMRKAVPEAIVGAGTLTVPEDFARVVAAGAQFAVTPGLTEELAVAGRHSGIPLLAGHRDRLRVDRGACSRLHRAEVLPGRTRGRNRDARFVRTRVRGRHFLPDRRHHARERAALPAIEECRLCRRFVGHAFRGDQGR
jgi:Entner-Doudoroff aldolase